MANNVKDCEHSIFCPTWTEWKCVKKREKIGEGNICRGCIDFKKKDKDAKEPECHCETCVERIKEGD